ncbi:MAG: lipoyl synthase [Thermodesulfovibrio sp.]|nr:lipoyl synthase [Thermodesulfovibrio sp.]
MSRLPEWIKSQLKSHSLILDDKGCSDPKILNYKLHSTKSLLRNHKLSTVCEEARCPNTVFCFSKPTATFMILGDVCTRNCAFCSVKSGMPSGVDIEEPEKIAEAALEMGLRYIVITSVTRDDLPDGGASQFAAAVKAVKNKLPEAKVEVLIPDFRGDIDALRVVVESAPDVFNHNIETVKRLYEKIRPQADYKRSLNVLYNARKINPGMRTKSGLMLGFGETRDEVLELFNDLRSAGCKYLTIGQYLRPAKKNLPVVEYIKPDVFEDLKETAVDLGFEYVAAGPLVRSSMNAEEMYTGGNKSV